MPSPWKLADILQGPIMFACFLRKSVELTWLSGLHIYTILILQSKCKIKKVISVQQIILKRLIMSELKKGNEI